MQCWQCGRRVREGAKLCIYCGADLSHDGGRAEESSRDMPSRHNPSRGRDAEAGRSGRHPYDDSPAESNEASAYRERDEPPRGGRDSSRSSSSRGSSRGAYPPVARDPYDDPRAPREYGPRSGGRERGSRGYASEDRERDGSARANRPTRSDDERGGPHDNWRGDGPAHPRRSRGYEDDYGAGGRGRYDDGYDVRYDARDRRGGGRDVVERGQPDPYARSPMDDSWNLPALAGQASEEMQSRGGGAGGGWGDTSGWGPEPVGAGSGRARYRPSGGSSRGGGGSGRLPVIALVVAIALALIAGGVVAGPRLLARLGGPAAAPTAPAFATYTPGPTPTPIAKFKEFASAQSHYVINYPADWSPPYPQNDTSQGQYDYIDTLTKSDPYMAVIVEQAQSFDAATDQQIIEGEVTGGQGKGLTFAATASSAATAIVGGEQWTRNEYDITQANRPTLHVVILACHHAGHGYALLLVAQSNGFGQTYSSIFQKVLSSFRFVK